MSLQQMLTVGSTHQASFVLNNGLRHEGTNGNVEEKKVNLLQPEYAPKTESFIPKDLKKFQIHVNTTPTPINNVAQKSFVNGVVTSFDDITVTCLLKIKQNQEIEAELPRILFPKNIGYGIPITLEMIEEHGIRKPRVTLRDVDPNVNKDLRIQLEELIQEL